MDYEALRTYLEHPPARTFYPCAPRGLDLPCDVESLDWIRIGEWVQEMSPQARIFGGCLAAELVLPIWEAWIRDRSPEPSHDLDEESFAAIRMAPRNAIITVLSDGDPERCRAAAEAVYPASDYAFNVSHGRTADMPEMHADDYVAAKLVDPVARRAQHASRAAGNLARLAWAIDDEPDNSLNLAPVMAAAASHVDDDVHGDRRDYLNDRFYRKWWSRFRARLAFMDATAVEFELVTTEPAVPRFD